MEKPNKFNYVEPSIGVGGRLHCGDCIHTICEDGYRHYGIIKTLSIHDPDYAKLVAWCKKQEAYVKPYAWCDKLEVNMDAVIKGLEKYIQDNKDAVFAAIKKCREKTDFLDLKPLEVDLEEILGGVVSCRVVQSSGAYGVPKRKIQVELGTIHGCKKLLTTVTFHSTLLFSHSIVDADSSDYMLLPPSR